MRELPVLDADATDAAERYADSRADAVAHAIIDGYSLRDAIRDAFTDGGDAARYGLSWLSAGAELSTGLAAELYRFRDAIARAHPRASGGHDVS